MILISTGATSGDFNFQVTDGLNFAPWQIFSITAQTLVISLEVNKQLGVFPGLFFEVIMIEKTHLKILPNIELFVRCLTD